MPFFNLKTAPAALICGPAVLLMAAGCANAKSEPPVTSPKAETSAGPVITEAPTKETLAENLDDGEPRPYDKTRDARADVDATLFAAKEAGKHAIIVMGANWCHDSRDLAAHFMTPRFETLLSENFEYVYVDMGIRNRNLDIAADFGIDKVEGTPTIIITGSEGEVLNLDTAKTWRNAADRTDDEIYEEFLSFAPKG